MSGFRGRGRGGGGPPKGSFVKGAWYCDCNPRTPAIHFQVKKEGPNTGRWFRTCQKDQKDKTRCTFFLWDDDAHGREAAALASNSRTEPDRTNLVTPSRRQPSPPPPYAIESGPSEASRKRRRSISDTHDDEYGFGQVDDDFNSELDNIVAQVETPSKAVKTSNFATPATTRRKLPWEMDRPVTASAYGLQTPQTDRRVSGNPFASRFAAPGSGSLLTPAKVDQEDDEASQTATPSSSFETPTPKRFKNVAADEAADDLVRDVFSLLREADVQLELATQNDLRSLLSKHARSAKSYKSGRDVSRSTITARDAKITELTYRINTLEAELEAEKAMVKHLQWEAQDESLDT